MPKVRYQVFNFSQKTKITIAQAATIIEEYSAQGYDLTLRQLYYQFVARDLIRNRQSEYKRLGSIVNDARLAGFIDWDDITDRTRDLESVPHWADPAAILSDDAVQFRIDRWESQPVRVEVWIEKEALAGVFERVCRGLDVAYFACRGYTSQSEMWKAARRFRSYASRGQSGVILHFGDHDPSGIDMTRDIADRLELFGADVEIRRLALNMEQVEEYDPPPNPAKTTDSRFEGYLAEYGSESWELDALEPSVLADLVRAAVEEYIEPVAMDESIEREDADRELLGKAALHWPELVEFLDGIE